MTFAAAMDPASPAGFPEDLRLLMRSVPRSEARSSDALASAATRLVAAGVDEAAAVQRVYGRFPVAGPARYQHDWWYPRFGPGWRLHQGIDIFAPHGTPVLAPADGVVRVGEGGLGGLWVRVVEADGTYWYLAHLSGVAAGIASGTGVAAGDVVGYVGNTGNARTTPPHLHLQLHPGGGAPVDPKPVLDRLLDEALQAVGDPAGAEPPAPAAPAAPPSPLEPPGPAAVERPGPPPVEVPAPAPAPSWWSATDGTGAGPGGTGPTRRDPLPAPGAGDEPVVVAAALAAAVGLLRPPRPQRR